MRKIFIVVGLGFGDEGKGSIVDFLTHQYNAKTVIRYNGGPQAAHNVVLPSGKHHCFSQFGSGTLVPGVKTFLSDNVLIEPENLLTENEVLKNKNINDGIQRISISSSCSVIAPFHKMIGQMLEVIRDNERYGTTGTGVGQAVYDRNNNSGRDIKIMDFLGPKKNLEKKLKDSIRSKTDYAEIILSYGQKHLSEEQLRKLAIVFDYFKKRNDTSQLIEIYADFASRYRENIVDEKTYLEKLFSSEDNIIFEGAQGVLLDPNYGFPPYVTKTDSTLRNALDMLRGKISADKVTKIGILRAYGHRHGTGPFVTEDQHLTEALPETHNQTNVWQGLFRIGWLDLLMARYSVKVSGGIDSIALTNLDRLTGIQQISLCNAYEYEGGDRTHLDDFFEWEYFAGKRIRINAIKTPTQKDSRRQTLLSKMLFDCRPHEFINFEGWNRGITGINGYNKLPKQAVKLAEFLQSKYGIGIPISIIGTGPTYQDKILV